MHNQESAPSNPSGERQQPKASTPAKAPGRPPAGPQNARREAAGVPVVLRSAGLYLLLILASLSVAGATFIVIADPAELVRDRLVAQAQARTGRDLFVEGGASLTLFPSLGVVMRDVVLSGPDASAPPVLRAKSVTAHVAWRPLLTGRVAVTSLGLMQPTLELVVDADGRRNWDFADFLETAPAVRVRLAQLAQRFQHGQGLPPELYEALERSVVARSKARLGRVGDLQNVSATGAALRYTNARTGTNREIAGVDLRLDLSDERRVGIAASATWGGERAIVEGELQRSGSQQAKLKARIGRLLEATWHGGIAPLLASSAVEGQISVRAESASALAELAGFGALGALTGALSIDGGLRWSGEVLELDDAAISLEGATASGSIAAEPMRQPPLIRADLKLSELDLHRYVAGAIGHQGKQPARANDPREEASRSIGDLLRRTEDDGLPATPRLQARGGARRGVWSTEPIDLAGLQRLDIGAKLEIDRLSWQEVRLNAAHVNLTLDNGKLTAEVKDAELYEGHGRAVLTVHEEGSAAVVGFSAAVEDAATLALMRDAAGFDWVEGRGALTLALNTRGASERDMIDHLDGRAEFKVTDGAVVGWNVTRMLRKLRQGQANAVDRDQEDKTPFSVLAGSFTIKDGLATSRDLKMSASTVSLSGAGTIALPQQTVDYTVRPRFAVSAGRGSTAEPLSIEVPVHIQGAWTQPRFTADIQAALQDPRTAETVQQIGRQLRSGNVDDAVKRIFGDGPEAEEKAAKAKELLQRFLKQ